MLPTPVQEPLAPFRWEDQMQSQLPAGQVPIRRMKVEYDCSGETQQHLLVCISHDLVLVQNHP
eukprot:5698487-Pyramimonas_sp.AAC.1